MIDFANSVPVIIALILLVAILAVAIKWCSEDARLRGKSAVLVSIAVIFFFPWGLVAWLVFRPPPRIGPRTPQPFRLDDHRVQ